MDADVSLSRLLSGSATQEEKKKKNLRQEALLSPPVRDALVNNLPR